MQYNKKTWNYALVAVSIMVVAGLGTAYAVTVDLTAFEDFCEEEILGWGIDAADFICDVDIYQMKSDIEQMKSDIEQLKSISFDSRTWYFESITINALSTNGAILSCPDGTYITNVGYLRTDDINIPIPEHGLDLAVSFQLSDTDWHLKFINPIDESIVVHIYYSCLG